MYNMYIIAHENNTTRTIMHKTPYVHSTTCTTCTHDLLLNVSFAVLISTWELKTIAYHFLHVHRFFYGVCEWTSKFCQFLCYFHEKNNMKIKCWTTTKECTTNHQNEHLTQCFDEGFHPSWPTSPWSNFHGLGLFISSKIKVLKITRNLNECIYLSNTILTQLVSL